MPPYLPGQLRSRNAGVTGYTAVYPGWRWVPDGASACAAPGDPLGVEAQAREEVARVTAERARVLGSIRANGADVPDSQANFVWLGLGADTAEFAEAIESAGCVVRPFAGDGVRMSIGTPAENDTLLAGVASWMSRTSTR